MDTNEKLQKILGASDTDKIQMLLDPDFTNGISDAILSSLLMQCDNAVIYAVLTNVSFTEAHRFPNYTIEKLSLNMKDEYKIGMLKNPNILKNNNGKFNENLVSSVISSLTDDSLKLNLLETGAFSSTSIVQIVSSFQDENKVDFLLDGKYLTDYPMILRILKSMSIDSLAGFFKNHHDFFDNYNVYLYEITSALSAEQQEDFIKNMEKYGISISDQKAIYLTLKDDVKSKIDMSKVPKECIPVFSMKRKYSGLDLDYTRDPEDYRGLDDLINVAPENFSEEKREYFLKLCDICPRSRVVSMITSSKGVSVGYNSYGYEYKEGEEWIQSVLDSIPSNYTAAQKLAVIDHAIGKKISYSPDFDTEAFDKNSSRALWTIISSGYGVCNGIANVERYMLKKVGIDSELVSGKSHAFLKVNDIELPLAYGKKTRGTTIVDPTWNLSRHRFDARPENFCLSYEQIRKHDLVFDKDFEYHKNDYELSDATLGLDDDSLRYLYQSVGLVDSDLNFPAISLMTESQKIGAKLKNEPEKLINAQLDFFVNACPEFATCQNSTQSMLASLFLVQSSDNNLSWNKLVIKRVYSKADTSKKAVSYVYI